MYVMEVCRNTLDYSVLSKRKTRKEKSKKNSNKWLLFEFF